MSLLHTQNHNLAPMPIKGRASHTFDLQAYEYYYNLLLQYPRASTDSSLNHSFWDMVKTSLKQCVGPIPFEESETADQVIAKGPQHIQSFVERVMGLALFNPIYPSSLAQHSKLSVKEVLTELLYATKVGMLKMRWSPECIRCGSAVLVTNFLSDVPAHEHCKGCNYPNAIEYLDRIKVSFTFKPEILYILANNYACVPSQESMTHNVCFAPMPATNNGSGFRYSFGCGDAPLGESIPKGTYRVHCPVSMTDHYLVVERDAQEGDEDYVVDYKISNMVVTDPELELQSLTIPHGKVHFDLYPDTRSFFVLWIQENLDEERLLCLPDNERTTYTSASEVINHNAFHLFTDQVVPQGNHSFEMEETVLVFTDIVGSTDLYAKVGDGEALRLVRHYFEILFASMASRGRIVKTIGDAVMASFATSQLAIEAVAEALIDLHQHTYDPQSGESLEMRVGLHSGPSLVVPVNGINDYFGQTVNISARVQSKAGASKFYVTEAALAHPNAQATFDDIISKPEFQELEPQLLDLKGVSEPVAVRGFQLVHP